VFHAGLKCRRRGSACRPDSGRDECDTRPDMPAHRAPPWLRGCRATRCPIGLEIRSDRYRVANARSPPCVDPDHVPAGPRPASSVDSLIASASTGPPEPICGDPGSRTTARARRRPHNWHTRRTVISESAEATNFSSSQLGQLRRPSPNPRLELRARLVALRALADEDQFAPYDARVSAFRFRLRSVEMDELGEFETAVSE
jgi:hypothetical protein